MSFSPPPTHLVSSFRAHRATHHLDDNAAHQRVDSSVVVDHKLCIYYHLLRPPPPPPCPLSLPQPAFPPPTQAILRFVSACRCGQQARRCFGDEGHASRVSPSSAGTCCAPLPTLWSACAVSPIPPELPPELPGMEVLDDPLHPAMTVVRLVTGPKPHPHEQPRTVEGY